MAKYRLEADELYPVFTITPEEDITRPFVYELNPELVTKYEDALRVVRELGQLLDEARD